MVMCSRCHKRPAVVFMTKLENGKRVNEGVCITCAKELGLPLDNLLGDYMSKMGITQDQLAEIEEEMAEMMGGDENEPESGAPAIDLPNLFKQAGLFPVEQNNGENKIVKKEDSGESSGEKRQKKEKTLKFLDGFCTNITRRARNGELDAIVGRERELARVIQILCRRQKNNPCLIGEPGVGKTAIAEALAQKIVAGDVPYKLKNKEI